MIFSAKTVEVVLGNRLINRSEAAIKLYLIMKADRFDVVEDVKQVSLDGMRVRRLAQDLQKSWIRHEEKTREEQTLLLQIPSTKR